MINTLSSFLLAVCLLLLGQMARSQPVSAPTDSLRNLLRASQADTNQVKLLLALGRTYVFKPGEQKADLDTAILWAQQAFGLSRRIGYGRGQGLSYLVAGQAQREKKIEKLGKSFAQQAIKRLEKWGSNDDKAGAYMELANYYTLFDRDLKEKIKLYERIIPLLQHTHDKKKLADALLYRGDLYQIGSNFTQSMSDLRQALTIYQSIGHHQLQGLYDLMGMVSTETGDLEAGLRYGLMALKLVRQYRDSTMLITICNRLGNTYLQLKIPNEATNYYQKALAVAKKRADTSAIITVSTNLVTAYRENNQNKTALTLLNRLISQYPTFPEVQQSIPITGNLLRIYTNLGQLGKARQASIKLLALSKNMGKDDPAQDYVYIRSFSFFLSTKQYAQANQMLLWHNDYCKRTGLMSSLSNNYLCWFKLDSALGNYPSAIRYYQRYHLLSEQLVQQNRSKQIGELDIQYKTYEKQLDIQQLTHKSELQQSQLGLQQAQLSATQLSRNSILAVAILLILLLGLLYNRYSIKQRGHQLLTAKQIEINQKNESLQRVVGEKEELLSEKEWMLKEIHHRVKNNLQIVAGLLYSQSIYLKDKTAQSAVRESQNRVQAMALLHQKLYQSDRLASVPMSDYIHEIVDYLIHSFDLSRQIEPQFAVVPLELDVTLAVPLGLIINEAVTNSLKYGFPPDTRGTICIQFQPNEDQRYLLRISDDGLGLPADFDPKRSRSLGMSLIRGLSKQIGADLQITSEQGVTIDILFRKDTLSGNPLHREKQ